MSDANKTKTGLDRYGVRGIVRVFVRTFIHLAVLLISAGKISWINGWLYAAVLLFYQISYITVMVKVNPQLLNEWGKGIRENTKTFDKILSAFFIPLVFITLIIAALDAGRYEWSTMFWEMNILGIALFIPACALSLWAMIVNNHFEPTVRIQHDRNHQVCTSGPYRVVRHPGYIGFIIVTLCTPLILGSWWGFLPTAMIILVVATRTALEDRTLQKELAGYKEYTKITRYRLIPFVW